MPFGLTDFFSSLFGSQDPGNPFRTAPPTFAEILLRGFGGALPPPGRLFVPNTPFGRIAGTTARLGGSLAEIIGQEMAQRRNDPLQRLLTGAPGVIQGLRDVRVPGETLEIGGPVPPVLPQGLLRARPPTEFPEEPPELDLPGRKARSFAEALQFGTPQQIRGGLALRAAGFQPQEIFPPPSFQEQLSELQQLQGRGGGQSQMGWSLDPATGKLTLRSQQPRVERVSPGPPATVAQAQSWLEDVVAAWKANRPVPSHIAQAYGVDPQTGHQEVSTALGGFIHKQLGLEEEKEKRGEKRTEERERRAEERARTRLDRIIPRERALYVTEAGDRPKTEPKTLTEAEEQGLIRLRDSAEARSLFGAKRAIMIQQKLKELIPQVLTRFKGRTLGNIFRVQGNRLLVKSAQFAGDPVIRKLQAFLIDYTTQIPLALGLAPGREGPRLLQLFEPGIPNLGDSVESGFEVMDANFQSIQGGWSSRGINIAPAGEIEVIELSTGRLGRLPAVEFDPSLYKRK